MLARHTAMRRAGSGIMAQGMINYSSLLRKVSKQYEEALKAQSLFFYPSKVTVLEQDVAGPSQQQHAAPIRIPWTIRCVPALLDKAKEKRKKEGSENESQKESESKGQNADDVFAPPYHPDLLVEEIGDHTVLLNKFCVVPKHFLLVTREFQPQTMPPAPSMLSVAYNILRTHKAQQEKGQEKGGDLLAFYNCGKVSGASQPHQHMQFAELGERDIKALPIDVLEERLPEDSKEDDVFAHPLPYQHFVTLLKSVPSQDVDNGKALERYLGSKLLMLIDSLFQARLLHAESKEGNATRSQPSWNLLMTTTSMHLIPREQEEFHGLVHQVEQQGNTHQEDGVDLVGALSINSLGYAGHLLVKSEKELEYLRDYPGGVAEILRHTGAPPVPNFTASKP